MAVSLNHLVLPIDRPAPGGRKPPWLKMKMPAGEQFSKLLKLVNDERLHTVCQSAKCPNMGECWAAGTLPVSRALSSARRKGLATKSESETDSASAKRRDEWFGM